MAGRHGNKGVISKIAPIEDMPHTEDGVPVDIVLNPLGVPSRMNVGQILETHLGWASAGLAKNIKQIINNTSRYHFKNTGCKDIKKYLHLNILRRELKLSDKEIVELLSKVKNGLNLATPVFDGASDLDIKTILEAVGLDNSGQVTLIDGRTGEALTERLR